MGSKLFEPACWNNWTTTTLYVYYASSEVLHLDPVLDRLLLENIARNASGSVQKAALRRLKLDTVPEPELVSDDFFDEEYLLLQEQVKRVTSIKTLKEAAEHGPDMTARFALSRLTGHVFPAPEADHLSHRTYECEVLDGLSEEEKQEFTKRIRNERGW